MTDSGGRDDVVLGDVGATWPEEPEPYIPERKKPKPRDSYNVPLALERLIPAVREDFQRYVADVNQSNVSQEEKGRLIRSRRESIRTALTERRAKAWQAYLYWDREEVKVTTKSSDGAASYGKCRTPSDPELRTSKAQTAYYRISSSDPGKSWGDMDRLKNGKWYSGNEETTPNTKSICAPNVHRSGKGRTMLRAFAIFRYPPAVAARKGREDADTVVGQIG